LKNRTWVSSLALLPAGVAALWLAGCGGSQDTTAKVTEAEQRAAEAELAAQQAQEELAAAKQAQVEAELAARQEELAAREAELAAKEAAAQKASAKPAPKPAAKPAAPAAAAAAAAPEPPPPPKPVVIPAGTRVSVSLSTPVSSKTNRRGDRIQGSVVSDVMIDGKVAIPTGAAVSGTVTDRVSGSKEIGATPMIGVSFDTLAPDADRAVAISSRFVQTGKSEGGKDAAKIAGGGAAGAIIGHQVDKDKGAVIGGLLGAVAGGAAAKNTGSEVEIPAGTVISLTLDNAVEMKP
jgi:hypothetical protein